MKRSFVLKAGAWESLRELPTSLNVGVGQTLRIVRPSGRRNVDYVD